MIGGKGIGAGIVCSVTGPRGSEGNVAVLPQQFPMGRYECSGNDGYDDRSRCLRRETRGPRIVGPSGELVVSSRGVELKIFPDTG
jgi:hypothetical protein